MSNGAPPSVYSIISYFFGEDYDDFLKYVDSLPIQISPMSEGKSQNVTKSVEILHKIERIIR
jgi:hypothetical protein